MNFFFLQSKAILLSKAMFACYQLADSFNIVMEYGSALKYVKIAMLCYGKIRYNLLAADLFESILNPLLLCNSGSSPH